MVYLKINQGKYYDKKKDFVKLYKKLKLKWEESKNINDVLYNGWFFANRIDEYVLKLPEEGDFKRFDIKGCKVMVDFLKSIGAVEFNIGESKKGEVGEDKKEIQYLTQEKRFGHFVGADLWNGYRVREILKDMPDNWGVIWSSGKSSERNLEKNLEKKEILK